MSSRSDRISGLPTEILSSVLSLLPSKTSSSTSILSRSWRNVFRLVPVIEARWNMMDYPNRFIELMDNLNRFLEFVDNMVQIQSRLHRFSVSCDVSVNSVRLNNWLTQAIARGGLLNLSLCVRGVPGQVLVMPVSLPSLVNLSIGHNLRLHLLENASHPKLETVGFDRVNVEGNQEGLTRLLVSSPILTELSIRGLDWDSWESCILSSTSLQKLTLHCLNQDMMPTSVSFQTPALVFLDYVDFASRNYGVLDFTSLVEARLDLRLTTDDDNQVVDASPLFVSISGVETLYMSSSTLRVLSTRCVVKPVFDRLVHLTLGIDLDLHWPSLPIIVEACPILDTLVFKGDIHVCYIEGEEGDELFCLHTHGIRTCLDKFKLKSVEIFVDREVERVMEMVEGFVLRLACLEQLTIYHEAADDLMERLSSFPRASPICRFQVLPHPEV